MGARTSSPTGDHVKCQEESERATEGSPAVIGRVDRLEAERLLRARPTFRRDKTALGYLLDEAGIPWCRAVVENRRCLVDYQTGEFQCEYAKGAPPKEDCRQASCPHAPLMRMRLHGRMLRAAAAKKRGVR